MMSEWRREVNMERGVHRSRSMSGKLALGLAVLPIIGVTMAILIHPPAWIVLLLGTMALAALYIIARRNSRYDPLDPRFGSCIPPIQREPRDR